MGFEALLVKESLSVWESTEVGRICGKGERRICDRTRQVEVDNERVVVREFRELRVREYSANIVVKRWL